MKYIFLAFRDENQWDAMSAGEQDALERACLANEQALRQSGHLFAIESRQSSRSAITVRVVKGKVSLTDGSFSEINGQRIQFFFVNARDLNEAIQVASKMPQARTGRIEVRPILELDSRSSSN
jgi:hypothetical protein